MRWRTLAAQIRDPYKAVQAPKQSRWGIGTTANWKRLYDLPRGHVDLVSVQTDPVQRVPGGAVLDEAVIPVGKHIRVKRNHTPGDVYVIVKGGRNGAGRDYITDGDRCSVNAYHNRIRGDVGAGYCLASPDQCICGGQSYYGRIVARNLRRKDADLGHRCAVDVANQDRGICRAVNSG